jgi:uncharacterized glyoxalase superfamily protein PhnB
LTATLQRVVPILRIFSIEKAREFYLDYLGFTWDWEHRFGENFPLYAQVSRGDVSLHLSEHHGDGSPGTSMLVFMTGIEDFHRELTARNYRFNRPGLEHAEWGARTVTVQDPFFNRLTFAERT